MTAYPGCAGLARSPFVLTEHISSIATMKVIGERAKRARHYLDTRHYIYVWRYVCHISSACHAYVMWAELGHCQFLYMPAVLNVVTTGNGAGTKNILKWNRALGFEFSIQFLSTALLLKQNYAYSLPGHGVL